MKQEEKDLLLKDLCARLPYGVKVIFRLPQNSHSVIEILRDVEIRNADVLISTTTWNNIKLEVCKPFLRLMSSMTEEEEKEFQEIKMSYHFDEDGYILFDWLNKKGFDYRGLIPMGIALEAPKDMYKLETLFKKL